MLRQALWRPIPTTDVIGSVRMRLLGDGRRPRISTPPPARFLTILALMLAPALPTCTGGSTGGFLSVVEFRTRLLETYPTAEIAFADMGATSKSNAAVDASTLDIHEFVQATATFQQPLDEDQAHYIFAGLDVNLDGALTKPEFVDSMNAGMFLATITTSQTTSTSTSTVSTTTWSTTATTSTVTTSTTSMTNTSTSTTSSATTTGSSMPERMIYTDMPGKGLGPIGIDGDVPMAKFWEIVDGEIVVPPFLSGWPTAIIKLLDKDGDNVSTPEEFLAATSGFKVPLTSKQAETVFYQLDTDHDHSIGVHEVAKSVKESAIPPAITFAEYSSRARQMIGVVGISMQVAGVDITKLRKFTLGAIKRMMVLSFAEAGGVSTKLVRDATGRMESVLLSPKHTTAEEQSLQQDDAKDMSLLNLSRTALVIQGCIEVTNNQTVNDIIGALERHRKTMAEDLSQVRGVQNAGHGKIDPQDISFSGLQDARFSFFVADIHSDGSLDRTEFTDAAKRFQEPLTYTQVEYSFRGLDSDYDGKLSAGEFTGATLGHFVGPVFMGRTISIDDFTGRMWNAYGTSQDAFDAMKTNPAGINNFLALAARFKPPLTREQAEYAFEGLDTDRDGLLVNTEFLEALRFGNFFATTKDIQAMFAALLVEPVVGCEPTGALETCPLALSLACLLLFGYLLRTAFLGLRLPGIIGVILCGGTISFAGFLPAELLAVRGFLQELIFLFVLFTVGFELSVADMRAPVIIMSVLPALLEMLAIASYGAMILKLSTMQALLLGNALFALDGGRLSITMSQLGKRFEGHPVPRLVFTRAPAESCFALVSWGVLTGLAAPASEASTSGRLLAIAGVLRAAASVAGGLVFGFLCGKCVSLRHNAQALGRRVFTGTPVEAALMAAVAALAGYSLHVVNPFQPEIVVVVLGATLAFTLPARDLEAVDSSIGGVSIFAQLLLFGLLGMESDLAMLSQVPDMLPMMCFGLAFRFVGVFFATFLTMNVALCSCAQCKQANKASLCADALFCFFAALPRATLQGIFGSATVTAKAFHALPGSANAQGVIAVACRLYAVFLSIVGSLLLDALGPYMLAANELAAQRCDASTANEQHLVLEGWTLRQRILSGSSGHVPRNLFRLGLVSDRGDVVASPDCAPIPATEAVNALAEAYLVDPTVFSEMLEKITGNVGRDKDVIISKSAAAPFGSMAPSGYASVKHLPAYGGNEGLSRELMQSQAALSSQRHGETALPLRSNTIAHRLAQDCALPPLSLFEAMRPALDPNEGIIHGPMSQARH